MTIQNSLQNQIQNPTIKIWNGFCECCGKPQSENFKIWKRGNEIIKGLCLDCENKNQCEVCFKWVKKIAYLQVNAPGIFKWINFCSNECKKEARKQIKAWIKNFCESNGIKKECKECGNTKRALGDDMTCSNWRACANEKRAKWLKENNINE